MSIAALARRTRSRYCGPAAGLASSGKKLRASATLTSGVGGEVAALVQEHCFSHLEAPIVRVTGWDTPYPHAQEWDYSPGPARVGRALNEVMEG